LLRSGASGLVEVFRQAAVTVYEVPHARPLLTGPARARVLLLAEAKIVVEVAGRGRYRLAVRYSPYWRASPGCVTQTKDGMVSLVERHAGVAVLTFHLDPARALDALAGEAADCGAQG